MNARHLDLVSLALQVCNKITHLLKSKEPDTAEFRSRYTPECDPAKLYAEYKALSTGEFCPECFISCKGKHPLVVEAETNSLDVMKCVHCGATFDLPKKS